MEDESHVKNGVQTLAELKERVDCVLQRINLRWDNCLLMTSYCPNKSFVLMTDGSHVVVNQPLRELVNAFAHFNNCLQSNIYPSYQLLGQRVRGIVAGMNRLLPTGGLHNPNLAFYTARFLAGYVYLPENGTVALHFSTDAYDVRISIPAYKHTFAKILADADELSNLQLSVLHYLMHCYAYKHECTQLANSYHRNREMRQQVLQWEESKLLWVVNEAFKQHYGQPVEEEMKTELIKVMERCYQTK